MSVKDSGKGALSPLLLLWRSIGMATALALAVACASHAPPSPVFASGYIADRGVVRMWRKDDAQQHATLLVTMFNSFRDKKNTIETRYQFVSGELRDIQRTYHGERKDVMRLRFAEDGTVSFMQRQLDERRERVSEDEIALSQFDAKRLLELSEFLRAGQVALRQGRWQDGRVITCEGQSVSPNFDASSLNWIAQQRRQTADAPGIAWLDASEGTQVLLVTAENLCGWKPFIGD